MNTEQPAPICDHNLWEGWDEDCAANHVDDLAGAIRSELYCLWSDLDSAQREAINGTWSIRCDDLVHRIVSLSRLVGSLPWVHVPWPTLENGVYVRVHDEAGIEYEPIDWTRVRPAKAYGIPVEAEGSQP